MKWRPDGFTPSMDKPLITRMAITSTRKTAIVNFLSATAGGTPSKGAPGLTMSARIGFIRRMASPCFTMAESHPPAGRARAEGEGEVMMRVLVILAAIIGFSASAVAQTAAPKAGGKPLKQARPLAPMGCKLVGTVRGTKLWAGDCVAGSELRSSVPAGETSQPLPEQPTGAIPPGQKE